MTQPSPDAIAAARAAARTWGVPASISLGQYALESAWGAKPCGSYNYFGMKALKGQASQCVVTHEVYKGNRIEVQALFRCFASAADAFDAHAKLLATAKVYGPARAHLPDVAAFAHALTGTYATDPHYGDSLMAVIRGSRLTQYDT